MMKQGGSHFIANKLFNTCGHLSDVFTRLVSNALAASGMKAFMGNKNENLAKIFVKEWALK